MFHAERNWPVPALVLDFMDFGDIAIPTLNQRVGSSSSLGPPYTIFSDHDRFVKTSRFDRLSDRGYESKSWVSLKFHFERG